MRIEKRGFALAFLAALTLFFCLLGASGAARAADSYQLKDDTSKWAGTLTNVTSNPEFVPKFSLGDSVDIGGIPLPTLVFDVTIKIGIECDFDLDIRQGTLENVDEKTPITEYTHGLSNEKISDNLFDYLPNFYTMGLKVESFLRIAATDPIKLKGHMRNIGGFKLSTESGLERIDDHIVDFTSIRPGVTGKKVVFYVGSQFKETLTLGHIDILGFIGVGPLLKGEATFISGAVGRATLEKDEVDLQHIPDNVERIHTCTENGKDGCVYGSWREVSHFPLDLSVNLKITIIVEITIYEKHWTYDTGIGWSAFKEFRQSLTWGEPMNAPHNHIVWKVPAALWQDVDCTTPVKNWGFPVHPTEPVQVDPNVRHLTSVKPDPNTARLNLYLPMKAGRYTLTTTDGEKTATAEQYTNMSYGANMQVDLILGTNELRRYSVKKKWDIDIEDKDRPASIQVALQRSSKTSLGNLDFSVYTQEPGKAWQTVQWVELNPQNNWEATFSAVPVYEIGPDGEKVELRYRVRELRPANEEAGENPDYIEHAYKRVVPDRWDLDNTYIWEKLKGKITNWQTYWQIEPTKEGLEAFLMVYAGESLFPHPSVTYKVPEYTNLAGQVVKEHDTYYWVEYEEEEGDEDQNPREVKMTITNTAALSVNIYKRWINLGKKEDLPDYVFIALLSRPQKEYLQLLPATVQRFASMWLPVFRPLSGDSVNVLSLVGLDSLAGLDILGLLDLPIAVAKVNKPSEDSVNPLIQWRAHFLIKKYGFLGFPGIPIELEGAELSSVVLQNLIKFLTGLDIPVSIGLQGFVTVTGKAYQIPVLDKEWERTSNIINVKLSPDEDQDPDAPSNVVIGGVKYWKDDMPEGKEDQADDPNAERPAGRPNSIVLHIKDGETPVVDLTLVRKVEDGTPVLYTYRGTSENKTQIGKTVLAKNDYAWPWALKQSDLPSYETIKLDPDKTYTITEDTVKDYVATVNGHDIINSCVKDRTQHAVVWKYYTGEAQGKLPRQITAKMTLPDGKTIDGKNEIPITLHYDGTRAGLPYYRLDVTAYYDFPAGTDITRLKFKEDAQYSHGYVTTYSGPDWDGYSHNFTITNTLPKKQLLVIKKEWKGADGNPLQDSEIPDSVDVKLLRNGKIWETRTLTKEAGWSLEISDTYLITKGVSPDEITLEEVVPEGFVAKVTAKKETTTSEIRTTFTLTNVKIREEDKVFLWGIKTWNDNENRGQTRPHSITVHIRNNKNETVKDVAVGADEYGEWIWRVPGLPGKDADGQPISYYVTEDPVPVNGTGVGGVEQAYYVTSYKQPEFNERTKVWTCDIHNTLPANSTLIKVNKVWVDNNDEHNRRPESVRVWIYERSSAADPVTLLKEVELTARDEWQYTIRTDKKEGATYYVEEQNVPGYFQTLPEETAPDNKNTVSLTLTNTIRDRITVEKVWVGDGKYLYKRPASVTVELTKKPSGEKISAYLTDADGWKHEFNNADYPLWDKDGNPIEYTLTEVRDDYYTELNEYTTVVTGNAQDGFIVTNTLKPSIKITKVWNSGGRPDEPFIRPDSVQVRLTCAELGIDQELTITPQVDWELTLDPDEYPVFDENGREIPYTLTEIVEENSKYNTIVTGSAVEGFTVINTPKGRISITKRWVDGNYSDRPESVTVYIKRKGTSAESSVTLTRRGRWTTWLDPVQFPVKEAGSDTLIEYELREAPINGYSYSVSGNAEKGYVITNIRATMQLSVRKNWVHGANPVSQRPKSLNVRLRKFNTNSYNPTKETLQTVTLNAENNWSYMFENLPALNDGWMYTADEESQPDNYWMEPIEYSGNGQTEFTTVTITNRYLTQSLEVRVKKVWDDTATTHNPVKVTLRAEQDSSKTWTATLSANNNWSYTFTDLPIYYDQSETTPITYKVMETSGLPDGYTFFVTGNQDQGFTITNTLKKPITVKKVWNDNNNAGQTRPTTNKVTVHLKKGTDTVADLDISASNEWTGTFPNTVPVYDEYGELIDYTLTEDPVPGYSTSITGNARDGFTVVNTLEEHLSITKRWMDGNYANRPKEVRVYLKREDVSGSAPQEIVLKKDENWTKILDPDEYPVGGTYTLTEEPINGYTYSYIQDSDHFIITNTRATMNVYVRKVWEHGANTGEKPTSVEVQLKKGNVAVGNPVPLNAGNNWQYTFENLDFLNDGSAYSVEEVEVPAGYTRTITRVGNGKTEPTSFTITNTYVNQTKNITVTKAWEDDNNRYHTRPESVAVRIEAKNDSSIFDEATLNADNGWTHTFTNLPVNYGQSQLPITYTVRELDLLKPYDVSVTEVKDASGVLTGFTITNTLKNEVHVTKVWNDQDNERGVRPESVKVYLKAPDGTTVREATLDVLHFWNHTFTGVQLYNEQGNPINYKVSEDPVPLYKTAVSGSALYGFIVTNSLKERITITKVWNDNDNEKGLRPSSVTVHLKKDGATIADLVLSATTGWTLTLDPDTYPAYDENGNPITYTLEEDPVAQYNSQVSGDAQHGFVVVNSLKDRISVIKVWVDENYPGRPDAVTFSIKKAGSTTPLGTFQLTKQNNWVTTLDADTYPVYDTSTTPATPIDYVLTEETPNGYSSSISGDAQQGFIARNIRNTLDISVYKDWNHGTNPVGKQPNEVTVQLKRGDRPIETVTLNAANNWRHTFSNLDALQDGSEYTVDEVSIPKGYTRTIARTTGDGKTTFTSFTITNTYVEWTRNVSVRKVWVGDDWFWRPASVKVRIEAESDQTIYDEATLSAANDWIYTFMNLRYYDSQGQTITYKVKEVKTPQAYTSSWTGDQDHGFIITNTLKTINVLVDKEWDDNNNQEGNRPDSIFVVLRGDGALAGAETIREDSSTHKWTYLFKDLPQYEDDILISYDLYESEIPGYSYTVAKTEPYTFKITNKAPRETINLNIEKVWAGDEAWKDEYRPDVVNITIAGGGKEYPVTLREADGWKATITGLPRYVNGKEANYFLNEWAVNGYQVSTEMTGPTTVEGVTTFNYKLTNTLVTTDIPVTKYWLDEEPIHPAVTFVLYSNRTAADEDVEVARLTMTEADARTSEPGSPWRGWFRNLPVYAPDDGRPILYTLQEEPVEGYVAPIILRESEQDPAHPGFIHTSFEAYNSPEPKSAAATVVKLWEDDGNAKGIRPREVITHLWNGDEEAAEILLTGEHGSYGTVDDLPMTDDQGRKITYTLTEEALECYDSDIQSTELEIYGRRIYLFGVTNTLREDACVLTYDPNGGILEGSTEPLKEGHRRGEMVSIHRAPTREGYVFLYWKGSEYYPGDDYTVTGDHTFVAQWVREDALDHKFTFTKRWSGTPGESIDWTFYDAEGHVVRKRFNKKVVSEVEWQYTAWFDSPREYYLVEKPVPGYETIYRNVGKYANITDRCYNGGTIINYRAPNTGDESRPILWIALGAAGLLLLIALVIKHRRKR